MNNAFVREIARSEFGPEITVVSWRVLVEGRLLTGYMAVSEKDEQAIEITYLRIGGPIMLTAYRCELCKHVHREQVVRCTKCDYPTLAVLTMTAKQFCKELGHDGGEICLPDTARYERTEFVPYVEDGCTIGGSDERIYSYKYLFRCARCGFEQRTRR